MKLNGIRGLTLRTMTDAGRSINTAELGIIIGVEPFHIILNMMVAKHSLVYVRDSQTAIWLCDSVVGRYELCKL